MSVFEAYKEEVSKDIQTITKLISELKDSVTSKDGKSCSSLEQEIKRIIGQANVNISMMNLEAQSADDASARNSLKKIVTFQSNSLRALKAEFDSIGNDMRKSSLFDKLNQNSSADAKNKLREIRAMEEEQNQMLTNACNSVIESEQMADDIILNLHSNNEQISHIKSQTADLNVMLGQAGKTTNRMENRDKCTVS